MSLQPYASLWYATNGNNKEPFPTVMGNLTRPELSSSPPPSPSSAPGPKRWYHPAKILFWVTRLLFLSVSLALVMGLYSGANYLFDGLAHFMLQYLVMLSVCLLLFLFLARWGWLCAAVICVILCAWQIMPYYQKVPQPLDKPAPVKHHLKLMQFNVLRENPDYDALQTYIDVVKPDVIALQEINEGWSTALYTYFKDRYPYQVVVPREDHFGIALYSKYPIENERISFYGSMFGRGLAPVPTIIGTLVLKRGVGNAPPATGDTLTLVVTHPLPPTSIPYYEARNKHLAQLSEAMRALPPNETIVLGDLNLTPWSRYFKRFVADTGLRDSMLGFGIQPSWPSGKYSAALPIDHALVSEKLVVESRHVGQPLGSDHLPIIVEIGL